MLTGACGTEDVLEPFKPPSPDSELFTNRTVRGNGAKEISLM